MEKREKTEFILDQMRLESQRGNWVRVRVGGRKINRAYLKEDGNADLKLRYYELIIALALEEDAFLDACKAYQEVYETAEVQADPARAQQVLESITYFIVLAPHDNEQSDMIHKLALKPEIEKLALHHDLVKSFTVKELMRWSSMGALYGDTMRASSVFSPPTSSSPSTKGDDRWEELHKRVIEHVRPFFCSTSSHFLPTLVAPSAV
jgi:26S proteasome regulatory subunit N5